MSEPIKLPDLGEGIDSADVVNVLVSSGDTVEAEQGLIEIETDKASVEVPAPKAGTIESIEVEPGQTVKVGETIATFQEGEAGEEDKAPAPEEKPEKKEQKAEPGKEKKTEKKQEPAEQKAAEEEKTAEEAEGAESEPEQKPATRSAKTEDRQRAEPGRPDKLIPAGPSVRRRARELGVNLAKVQGSGPGGRIEESDLMNYVRKATSGTKPAAAQAARDEAPGEADTDKWGAVRREKMSKVRRTIAEKMADSFSTIPHVTHFDTADVTAMDAFRKEHKSDFEDQGVKLTLLPFVMRAVASALKMHPTVNARIDMDSGEIVYKDYVSLGVAVDTDRGLVVPVLRNADQLSIAHIARQTTELAQKVREGDFSVDDLRGGTFTLSNVGSVGGWFVTPIINKPEAAILLVGRSKLQPVVYDGAIAQRLIMPLSLSYDHRLIDGATAARFMNEVIQLLECPGRLLLTI
jgi:pyruvate dehydrogenase E2 component (dihydrolipoamide acetyltransferase)